MAAFIPRAFLKSTVGDLNSNRHRYDVKADVTPFRVKKATGDTTSYRSFSQKTTINTALQSHPSTQKSTLVSSPVYFHQSEDTKQEFRIQKRQNLIGRHIYTV